MYNLTFLSFYHALSLYMQEPELDDIPDSATAVGLLKALFKKSRIGVLVEHTLAKELCEITKSGDPISVLGTKMEELPSDMRVLLKDLLRVFSKVRGGE